MIMKTKYIVGMLALTACMTSCDDLLDKEPLDAFSDSPTYWKNPENLQNQCNTFFNCYNGYGNGGGSGWFYYQFRSDDQVNSENLQWANTNVVASSSNWNDPYIEARRAAYIIRGASESGLSTAVANGYIAQARMNRAWNYFQLVRMYGDCVWVDDVMEVDDAGMVYAPRQDRDVIMDKVLEDLNFACEYMTGTAKDRFNKDMAYAMKSQICLWEGTFCKYRTAAENGKAADPTRAEKFLKECVSAGDYLLGRGYKLNDEYQTVYNSFDLGSDPEVIFYKPYAKNALCHGVPNYTMNTSGTYGISQDAFDSYLFLDGKPKATTTLDNSTAVAPDGSLSALLSVRDKRLSQTIDPELACTGHPYARTGISFAFTSYTGYGIAKYDNFNLAITDRTNNTCYTDAPIYWIPVIYLDYAEAKAELGTLSDADLNNTINKLYKRAGLGEFTVAKLSAIADPANNMGVSSLIWEIRRCRRNELMCDNWFRYWDLIRWHQLELMDNVKHPAVTLGANISKVTAWSKNDKGEEIKPATNADGNIAASYNQNRIFEARQYLYPIPTGQISLYPDGELEQNPLWK